MITNAPHWKLAILGIVASFSGCDAFQMSALAQNYRASVLERNSFVLKFDTMKPSFRSTLHGKSKLNLARNTKNDPYFLDPSILVSAKDDQTQRLVFAVSFIALAVGTNICIQLWYGPGLSLLGKDSFGAIRQTVFPILFGSIFAVVGVLHFVFVKNFARIVPPVGTWGGLWQAPTPFRKNLGISYGDYHSYWTGVVEAAGGLWLAIGGLGLYSIEAPAMLLFLLTVGVTPANLYMFTHDATPGGAIPRLPYPAGHIARFIVQCGLLSNFWIMAHSLPTA